MKTSILITIFCALASAVPHLQAARDIPNYPGLQFGSNGKLDITVFSDLHFGERKWPKSHIELAMTDELQPPTSTKTS
jgi:hypothetical protein